MSQPVARAPKVDVLAVPRQVDQLLTTVRDEQHRAILRNYRRQVLLELAGRWPEILTPEMTVPHPVYRSVMGAQTAVYDGIDEVAGFYRGIAAAGMTVSSPIDERIALADGNRNPIPAGPARPRPGRAGVSDTRSRRYLQVHRAAGDDLAVRRAREADRRRLCRRVLDPHRAGRPGGHRHYERVAELVTPLLEQQG